MGDGDEHRDNFEGELIQERCFDLELTCELAKVDRVLEHMRSQIICLAATWDIQTNWVHVSEIEMTGRHFSINAG